ncbi:MAG: MarR family transcriptional regulator [Bacteroidetes bacterium]|nr:MarR family transcriptional regulator [Bacteroidota bacterium]
MPTSQSKRSAAEIAELTFQLLANCQEKEERFAEQLKIHVSEFRCLRAFRGDRSLPVKTLVERINLSGSRLTRILGSLEKRGYIQRVIDEKDRRSITVTLSKRGIELSGKLEERYLQIHEEILEGIPKDVHAPLISGLQNMLSSLQGWLKNKR